MPRQLRLFLSGFIAGLLVFCTVASASFTEHGVLSSASMWIGILGGCIAALKDWQTYLADPPR